MKYLLYDTPQSILTPHFFLYGQTESVRQLRRTSLERKSLVCIPLGHENGTVSPISSDCNNEKFNAALFFSAHFSEIEKTTIVTKTENIGLFDGLALHRRAGSIG